MNAPELMEFLRQELLACHELLDCVEVPRKEDDQPLSLSQRIESLVRAYKTSCAAVVELCHKHD